MNERCNNDDDDDDDRNVDEDDDDDDQYLYCVIFFRALLQTSQLLNWFILDQKRQELVSTGVAGPIDICTRGKYSGEKSTRDDATRLNVSPDTVGKCVKSAKF